MPTPPQLYAEVALPSGLRQTFSYLVPPEFGLVAGHRVRVPFGRTETHGYVVALSTVAPAVRGLRAILGPDPAEPLVDGEMLLLTRWLAEYYLAPWGQVLDAALPPNVRRSGGRDRRRKLEPAGDAGPPAEDASAEGVVVGGPSLALTAEAARAQGVLVGESSLTLTAEQSVALARLEDALGSGFAPFLLQGVTGSGKTEVYLRLAERVVQAGGQVLLLVPEIAMGAQILARVQRRFPGQVGLYHSQAGDAERRRVWAEARAGRLPIVVGARSAVFVPLPRLALVIVDEEHEAAYKQEESPRYHGRDVAVYRGRLASALVVLGSATPSLESWVNAEEGKYARLELPSRIDGRATATVTVVDMAAQHDPEDAPPGRVARGGASIFSPPLVAKMRERIARREQTILFLNRRGHSTTVQCADCGTSLSCDQCDVVLTYHKPDRRLRCHYCNALRPEPDRCASCGGGHFFYGGFGTQRIEEELVDLLPGARVVRMDRDATRKKGTHGRFVAAMEAGDVDVLLGTQMVAKGFDFPRVTLVGVLQADQEFLLPDFRAGERGFQVLTQVAGRAGRGGLPGEVLFQTFQPDHYVIRAAAAQDYSRFVQTELDYRRDLGYPPFRRIIHLLVDGAKEAQVESRADHLADVLSRKIAAGRLPARSLGPAPMPISRLKGQYRWHLGLIGRSARVLHELALLALTEKPPRGLSGTRVHADVDPVSML